jgi:hypothetical protein
MRVNAKGSDRINHQRIVEQRQAQDETNKLNWAYHRALFKQPENEHEYEHHKQPIKVG